MRWSVPLATFRSNCVNDQSQHKAISHFPLPLQAAQPPGLPLFMMRWSMPLPTFRSNCVNDQSQHIAISYFPLPLQAAQPPAARLAFLRDAMVDSRQACLPSGCDGRCPFQHLDPTVSMINLNSSHLSFPCPYRQPIRWSRPLLGCGGRCLC